MAVVEKQIDTGYKYTRKIALVNLVEPQEGSAGYRYVATRVYDAETDAVTDEVLVSKGQMASMSVEELHYAAWRDLPTLDIRTKQLVGENKDKYCTVLSARIYVLADDAADDAAYRINIRRVNRVLGRVRSEGAPVHVLGHTFIDINGDKCYLTSAQLRKSDIIQHTHSTSKAIDTSGVYKRVVSLTSIGTYDCIPTLELDDTDTSIEDEEVEQIKMCKTLIGGWYTMDTDGTIQVDNRELQKQQLEELEISEGILHIPFDAFISNKAVKRIKLPDSVRVIGAGAFLPLENLEEVNIPGQVKELNAVVSGCKKLKLLDLSGIERLISFGRLSVKRLIMPDVLQKNESSGSAAIGVLEFRNMVNAEHRVLRAKEGNRAYGSAWQVGQIEPNGPVVLGDYKVDINCINVSALESNIVGIAPDSSFHKVDAEGNPQPWELGPNVEFVYVVGKGGYRFTEGACLANKLRLAVVSAQLDTVLPKSVEILQGVLSESMFKDAYPNVAYATQGLCQKCAKKTSTPAKLPSLRWLFPKGEILTEVQIKRLEKKLTSALSEICKHTQEVFNLDLTSVANLDSVKRSLLCAKSISPEIDVLFKEYGMIYVGDYNEALRGK